MTNCPKVSIITTTFNDIEHLKESLDCIVKQDYENIECIVIDGGSKDATVDYLKDVETKINNFKWISEADRGIYDAINKGLELATGEIIGCFFDLFTDTNVISKCVQTILLEGTDGVHADLTYNSNDKVIRYWKMGDGKISQGWMPGFPTLFLKRDVYKQYGNYKIDYKTSGDYEFIVRILKDNNTKLSYIPDILVKMYYGGTSTSSASAYWHSLKEAHRGLVENKIKSPYMIDLKRTIRVLFQFIRKPK